MIAVPEILKELAARCPFPLYVVGGYVRNFLIAGERSEDIDLAAPAGAEDFIRFSEEVGGKAVASYPRTGTAVVRFGNTKCEFTSFRKEKYAAGGGHTPVSTCPTGDIKEDALRRDFKCNAIYYDIGKGVLCDVLGGIDDIKARRLTAVKAAEEVFKSDGLRLMRLARFAAELGFTPSEEVMAAARNNAANIKDISPERIYAELKMILASDTKYAFSDRKGHYNGIKILSETRVLDYIIPELTAGRGMAQRADYHDYDVLEHSLRATLYAPAEVRLAALLHDIGKPYCKINHGNTYAHAEVGARMAAAVLSRLKADNQTIAQVRFLTASHMVDLSCEMKESKVRLFIAQNYGYIEQLLQIKQADFSACKDCLSVAPSVAKWREIMDKMRTDGTPFSLKELKITPKELTDIGFNGSGIGAELKKLFKEAVTDPRANNNERLKAAAIRDFKGGKN